MRIISSITDWFLYIVEEFVNKIQHVPRPNPIDWDLYTGFFSLFSNREIILALLGIHFLFTKFAHSCLYWDKVDYFIKKRAIHINDIPAGTYKYLITVYTNWRPNAGTKGKVYLQLHGVFARNSLFYYLHNPYGLNRKLFSWGDISWFLVNTANPLGDIQAITVAHDSFGENHCWLLSKIRIKDLQTNQVYRFPAHCWLGHWNSSGQSSGHNRIRLEPVDPLYPEPFGERMFEWWVRLTCERPLTGFFYLNLLSSMSRVRMLAITYFYVNWYLLLNLMYYNEYLAKFSFEWLFNLQVRSIVSVLLHVMLKHLLGLRSFTLPYPTEKQFLMRMIAAFIFFVLCLIQLLLILLYSIKYRYQAQVNEKIIFDVLVGLLSSELGYSLLYTLFRSYINTISDCDPFMEEEAKIHLTSRVSVYRKFKRNDKCIL